jgi:hypothetical protein
MTTLGEHNRRVMHQILELGNRTSFKVNTKFYISIYKKYQKFSPNQYMELILGFKTHGIKYDPIDYQVTTGDSKFRYQLFLLDQSQRQLIWKSLSDKQKSLIKALNALRDLGVKDDNFDSEGSIKYYIKVFAFTPKNLSNILYRMSVHGILHDPHDFRIIIRRSRDKEQLKEMEDWKVKKMWTAFSASQKKIYNNDYCEHPIPLDYIPS